MKSCSIKTMFNKLSKIKSYFDDIKVITVNLLVLIRTVFLGVVISEVILFSLLISQKVNKIVGGTGFEWGAIIIALLGIVAVMSYLAARDFYDDGKKILKSHRFDLLVALCFGIWTDVAWGGFLLKWYSIFVQSLSAQQVFIIILAPFTLGLLVIFRSVYWKTEQSESTFIPDKELEKVEDDLLNFTDKANRFAERVFNNGSSESFVFGVDAPWGIGKSTFINFCKKYWEGKYKESTVIYKFTPLKYSGSKSLLEIFVDGLIHAIQKDSFIPEIKPLISRYSRLLREMNRFSIFGFSLPTLSVDYTADEAFDDLSAVLQRFEKKVIIIVDDLDRMNFSEIKDILFVIRKSFILPNISYILCYDTENIGVLESEVPDAEKVSEFLEKFVNIKISLYLDREDLAKFVSDNLNKAIVTKSVDPMLVRQPIGGLLDIYKSPLYHKYLPFIGDVRKLKRLINTVMMFELEGTDFKNSDFDKGDLIHLLLIYIHYPNVFRKIYDTETKGGHGFFSLVMRYEDGYDRPEERRVSLDEPSQYRNSTYYDDYLAKFPVTSGQRFLLDQVFNVKIRLKDANVDSIPEEVRTSVACINGGWTNGRNLETYLDLIVNLSKPEDTDQHKFYVNWKDKIANELMTIKEVLIEDKFNYDKSDQFREKLLRIIVNNARTLKSSVADSLIVYLLDHIHEYSLLEIPEIGLGLRHNIDYFLIRFLNDAGWSDPQGKHSNNTPENIKEIAEWIFGEGRHSKNGVLNKLSASDRGVLGLYDLMAFRLFCSADRGGDIFDLSRALSLHSDEKAPTEGNTGIIAIEEMREISQKVFGIFKTQYIDKNKNIFEEISTIDQGQLTGKYNDYLTGKISSGALQEVDIQRRIEELKTRITSFTIYQLGSDFVSTGVPCGFYDPIGKKDEHGIKQLINDYLFDICFSAKSKKNVEYFIDYLFRNFANAFGSAREDGLNFIPSIKEFTKILDEKKLALYWEKQSATIKAMHLEKEEKTVAMGKEEASYKKYAPLIYKILDDHVESLKPKKIEPSGNLNQEQKSS